METNNTTPETANGNEEPIENINDEITQQEEPLIEFIEESSEQEQEEPVSEPIEFRRKDKVNYIGSEYRHVKNTFVWACNPHEMIQYVIQHPDGFPKEHFMATMREDGFESIHSRELKNGLLYVYCSPNDLELVERKEKQVNEQK